MTANKVWAIILLIVFATCQTKMAGMPLKFEDANYIFTFIISCFAVGGVLGLVRD